MLEMTSLNDAPTVDQIALVSTAAPCIYVHLTSGEIEELRPADAVRVGPESVLIFNGENQIAQYAARDVLFCSHLDISPFPFS